VHSRSFAGETNIYHQPLIAIFLQDARRRRFLPAQLMARLSKTPALLTLLLSLLVVQPLGLAATARKIMSVPSCTGISLRASYLAEIPSQQSPGFEFTLVNGTDHEIRLAEPVPSSSHWYALAQGRWLWRASNGAGGGLLDPMNERGRLVVFKSTPGRISGASFIVQPHQARKWVESERENPVLAYKPGCPLCSYPGEHEYRVIFAYAYLPEDEGRGWLACGIRSLPVPMPPKPSADGKVTGR
jgi:hypothetical protein